MPLLPPTLLTPSGASSAPGAPAPAALPQGVLSLSGDLNFGTVALGQSASQYLTMSNTGTGNLSISGIVCPAGFRAVASGVIPPGTNRQVKVIFTPVKATNYSGTLTVRCFNAGNATVQVSGTGAAITVNSLRAISVTGNLAFGTVAVGKSAPGSLTISNTGTVAITVGSISYPVGFSGNFMGTLQPGAAQTIAVTFTPPTVGSFGGMVTVNSTATSGTNTLAASGTGVKQVPPAVIITSPAPGQGVGGLLITVNGTVNYAGTVAGVFYQFNSGTWLLATTANRGTNWTAIAKMIAGTNTFRVYARSTDGLVSTTNTLTFVSTNVLLLRFSSASVNPQPAKGLTFELNVPNTTKGRIQYSTNLIDWEDWSAFTSTNGSVKFSDPSATNGGRRFYRAVVP